MPKIKKIKKIKKKGVKTYKPTVSKVEKEFGEWLISIGIPIKKQFKINYKFYDFLIKDTNVIIEFNGDYYHANPLIYETKDLNSMQIRNKKNDLIKRSLAEINGFEIIYIWENEFHKEKAKIKRLLKSIYKKKTIKIQN